MNYGEYMRKQEKNRQKIIVTNGGRDASDVTFKNQKLKYLTANLEIKPNDNILVAIEKIKFHDEVSER